MGDGPARKVNFILEYPQGEDGLAPGKGERTAYAVVYVRPETNNVPYERAIVTGIRRMGDPVYMANINGSVFLLDGVLEDHYVSQFRFARDPKGELSKYPEIASLFESQFGISVKKAPLIGSFEAVSRFEIPEEELFETIVPDTDFLNCWGQEFKRIRGRIIANPNLPAIAARYSSEANVLAIVVRSRGTGAPFFAELNRAIYSEVVSHKDTPVLDGERLGSMIWSEKIRRTYHISTGHIMAMYDMADLVFVDGKRRLDVADTPLGRRLLADGALTVEELRSLKRYPLVHLQARHALTLEYLPHYRPGMNPADISKALGALR
jgi:hypothetical protein